tara:strand:+ start:670 stop:798 length:129 start_codon:yes stop_codon:yes gene_type:complete
MKTGMYFKRVFRLRAVNGNKTRYKSQADLMKNPKAKILQLPE